MAYTMSRSINPGIVSSPTRQVGRGGRPVNPMLGAIPGEQVDFRTNGPVTGFKYGGQIGTNFAGVNGAARAIGGSAANMGTGWGGGGGVGGGSGGAAAASLTDLMNKANAKNEERYGELKGMADTTATDQIAAFQEGWKKVLGLIGTAGVAPALGREETRRQAESGQASQYAVSHGLANSTIAPSMQGGVNDRSAQRVEEIQGAAQNREIDANMRYAAMYPDLLQRLFTNKAGIVERRTDQAPDLGLYANVLSRPGAGGGSPTGGGDAGGIQGWPDALRSMFGGSFGGGGGTGGLAASMDRTNDQMAGGWTYTPARTPTPYDDYRTMSDTELGALTADKDYKVALAAMAELNRRLKK